MKKNILFVILIFETIRSSSRVDAFNSIDSIEQVISNESSFIINASYQKFYIGNFSDCNTSINSCIEGNGSDINPFIGFYEGLKEIERLLKESNSTNQTIIISLINEYYHINLTTKEILFDGLINLTIFIVPNYIEADIASGEDSNQLIQNFKQFIKENQKSKIIINLYQENFQINIQNTILFLVNLQFCGRDLNNFKAQISLGNPENLNLFHLGDDSEVPTSRSGLFLISCEFIEIISSNEQRWFFESLIYVSLLGNFSVYIQDSNFENLFFSEGIMKMDGSLGDGKNKLNLYFVNSSLSNCVSYNFLENNDLSSENIYKSPMILKLFDANAYIYRSRIENIKSFLEIDSAKIYILSSNLSFNSIQKIFISLIKNSELYLEDTLIEGNSCIYNNFSRFIYSKLNGNKISMKFMKIVRIKFEIFITINEKTSFNLTNSVISDSSMISFITMAQNNSLNFLNVSFSNLIILCGFEAQYSFIDVFTNNKLNLSHLWATNFLLCESPFISSSKNNFIDLSYSKFLDFYSPKNSYVFMHFVFQNNITINKVVVFDNREIKLQESNKLFIKHSFFVNLFSFGEVAVFVLFQKNFIDFEDSFFISIKGFEKIGLFYSDNNNAIKINLCFFEKLQSEFYAAISYSLKYNSLEINNSRFNGVKSRLEGGFFYMFAHNTVFMKNNTLSNGTSEMAAGFAYLEEFNKIEFNDSIFINFKSRKNGGVIYSASENEIKMFNSTFENVFGLHGGVFYLSQSTKLSIFSCNFTSIKSEGSGGVIFSQLESVITVQSCNFTNLIANLGGGAIYLDKKNTLSFSNSTIKHSRSEYQPGGVCFIGNTNNVSITDNDLYDSEGLSFGSFNNGSIISNIFSNLYSKNKGGSIFLGFGNTIRIVKCVFENSTSLEAEGFFYLGERNFLNITYTKIFNTQCDMDVIVLFAQTNNAIYLEKIEVSEISLKEGRVSENLNLNMGYESIQKLSNNVISQSKTLFHLSNSNILSINNSLFKHLKSETIIVCIESQLLIETTLFFNITAVLNMIINYFIENPAKTFHFYNNSLKQISTFNCLLIANTNVSIMNVNYQKSDNGTTLFLKGFSLNQIIIKNSYFINLKNNVFPENYHYGGFIEVKNSTLIIKKSNFINGRGMYGGSIYTESSTIYITKTFFLMNQASNYGGVGHFKLENEQKALQFVFLSKCHGILSTGRVGGGFISIFNQADVVKDKIPILNKTIFFEKSKIILNKAEKFGGAFYFLNVGDISFNQCNISKNLVGSGVSKLNLKGKGGSIIIKTDFDEDSNVFLKNISIKVNFTKCTFFKNIAFIGGFLFWEGAPVNINYKNTNFSLNEVQGYGSLRASNTHSFKFAANAKYKSFVKVEVLKDMSYLEVNELKSGNNYSECLAFIEPIDFYNQTALLTDEKFSEFQNNRHHNFSFLANSSSYCLDGPLIKRPGSNYSFTFKFDTRKYFNAVPLKVTLNFRQCLMGERLTDDLKCLECPVFTYSFNKDFTNTTELCKTCENENFNCYGGNKITPKPGYWRLSIESDKFFKCPYEQACLGDPNINTQNENNLTFLANLKFDPALAAGKCEEGYEGVVCFSCSLGYGRDAFNPQKCSKCATALQIFLLVFLIILKTSLIIWSIDKAIKMCITISSDSPDINKVISNNLLKILLNHLQTMALISELPIKWPLETSFLQINGIFMPSTVTNGLSFECILRELFPEKLVNYPVHYSKLIYIWIYPIFLVVICIIYLKIYSRYAYNDYFKKLSNASFFKYFKLVQPLYCIILMISYGESIQTALYTFDCIDVGYESNPHHVLDKEPGTECYTIDHYNYSYKVALPFCIIFGLCFPLFLFLRLLSHYYFKRLDQKSILSKYGYFYYGLEPHYFFWDFLYLIRKIAIIFLGIFGFSSLQKTNSSIILLIAFLILSTALYLQIYFKPYREKINIINIINLKSLIALAGSIFIGMFSLELGNNENKSFNIILFILMIILNIYFFIFWIHAYIVYNLKFIYLEMRRIFVKYFGDFTTKDNLIPEETLQKMIHCQKQTKLKLLSHESIAENINIENESIEMTSSAFKEDIEMVSSAFKEEISNKNHVISFSEGIEESVQRKYKRRFGKTLNNLEKIRIKRRLLFSRNDFDEINIDDFKRNSFDEENEAFICESNDNYLTARAQKQTSNIKLLLRIVKTDNETLHITLKIINENPIPIGELKIELENNPEIEFNVIPLEISQGIKAHSEEKFKIALKYKNLPYYLLICRLFMHIDSEIRVISFPLPNTIYHYLEFESTTLKIFQKTWNILSRKTAVIGPLRNSQMIFKSKDEISRIFNNKLVEYEIPYYRRETGLNSEKFGLLFKFKPKNRRYLMKIKKDSDLTQLEFCALDTNDYKSIKEDFYIYEVFSYLLVKD